MRNYYVNGNVVVALGRGKVGGWERGWCDLNFW